MRSKKRSIIEPLSPIIIPEHKSYWATHFYSILKCMDCHKNLKWSPRRFQEFPIWSLSLLRGNLPINFFEYIESYIKNWGFQYFITCLFNQKVGSHIIIELIERLEDLYGVCFNKDLDLFSFHVSGIDSSLSDDLNNRFADVFPFTARDMNSHDLIYYSDLCLILDSSIQHSPVGIFGEVEGIYGSHFRSARYWSKKDELCVFGIGVVDGKQKLIYFEESNFNGIPRVHLMFERSHFILDDYLKVLSCLNWLFMNGPHRKYPSVSDEFDFFVQQISNKWSNPIQDVFSFLERFISGSELVGFNDGKLNIITDIQTN
ncbi:hypothetical protein ABHF91_07000 [Pseudaeromonas sp. ZJS20]|uniref:hypothetical protein n=1 Tax=Pseudaeromonas aegiceratis TaxID=3153928 RepID=UPI00390C6202